MVSATGSALLCLFAPLLCLYPSLAPSHPRTLARNAATPQTGNAQRKRLEAPSSLASPPPSRTPATPRWFALPHSLAHTHALPFVSASADFKTLSTEPDPWAWRDFSSLCFGCQTFPRHASPREYLLRTFMHSTFETTRDHPSEVLFNVFNYFQLFSRYNRLHRHVIPIPFPNPKLLPPPRPSGPCLGSFTQCPLSGTSSTLQKESDVRCRIPSLPEREASVPSPTKENVRPVCPCGSSSSSCCLLSPLVPPCPILPVLSFLRGFILPRSDGWKDGRDGWKDARVPFQPLTTQPRYIMRVVLNSSLSTSCFSYLTCARACRPFLFGRKVTQSQCT